MAISVIIEKVRIESIVLRMSCADGGSEVSRCCWLCRSTRFRRHDRVRDRGHAAGDDHPRRPRPGRRGLRPRVRARLSLGPEIGAVGVRPHETHG